MPSFTFKIITLGCRVNQYESEFIRSHWLGLGGKECASADEVQIVCINSCAVTAHAERESRNAVYRARRNYPRAQIVLTGCAAKLFPAFPPAKNGCFTRPDMVLTDKNKILNFPLTGSESLSSPFFPPAAIKFSHFSRPLVKIQDGCNRNCSYCIVPQTRGSPTSRKPQEIMHEIFNLIENGHGEIVISGINLRLYNNDSHADLWDLLLELENVLSKKNVSNFRIRLSSLDPDLFSARAFEVLAASRHIAPHVHLSLQHGSDSILARMGRGNYTAVDIIRLTDNLGKIWPMFGLGADFIAGFPGETEREFADLLELMRNLPLSYAHVFPYSPRPGTAAATFPAQVPKAVKSHRAAMARQIALQKRQKFLERQLALQCMHIVAENEGALPEKGMNEYYVPCYFASEPSKKGAFFEAVPVRLFEDGIWVETIPQKISAGQAGGQTVMRKT